MAIGPRSFSSHYYKRRAAAPPWHGRFRGLRVRATGKRQNLPSGRKGCRAWLPSPPIKPLNSHGFPYAAGWPAGCKQVTALKIAEVPQCRVQRRTSVPRPQSRLRHGRRRRRRPKTTPKTMVAAPLRPCSMPPQPRRTPRIRSRNRPPHARPRPRPISSRRNSPPIAIVARPAQPRARRPARRRLLARRITRMRRQHRSQAQTQRSIQVRPRTRRQSGRHGRTDRHRRCRHGTRRFCRGSHGHRH